jgi:hypothetical protein
MTKKITFTMQARSDATTMAQLANSLADIVSVYFDRGYNSGGADPITDGDLDGLITAAELEALITLSQQFANFLGNAAVTQADYDATLNAVRTDL